MNAETIHDALTLLPADLIGEADKKRGQAPKTIPWQRFAAMAACFAIAVAAGSLFLNSSLFSSKSQSADTEAAAAEAIVEAPAAPRDEPVERLTEEQGVGNTLLTQPPELTILSGSQSLTVTAAGYHWTVPQPDGSAMSIITDTAAPTDFPDRHPLLECDAEAGDLIWSVMPLSVTAQCWDYETLTPESGMEVRENTLPFRPGRHIVQITAHWEQGSATYVITVNPQR